MFRKNLLLLFFVALKILLQFVLVHPAYDLHRDEYLHLDQGSHLAWGYVSIPPFTSWISWIIDALGGGDALVNFFPALFGALTMVVVWKTIEALNGNIYALVLAAVSIIFSALLRLNMLYQPNSFDILCWTFLYFCVVKYILHYNARWLWAAAVTVGIGLLNKYNIAFALVGLAPALLLSRHRVVFGKRTLYLAGLLALILVAPNIYWQYKHEFPVVAHMKELAATQLVNVNRGDFLREQLLFFFGSLPILLAGIFAFLFYKPFRPYRFLFWSLIITLAVFTYLKAKGYYAIGIYPVYIGFGAVFLEKVLVNRWQQRWIRPLLIVLPIALTALAARLIFPLLPPEQLVTKKEKLAKLGLLRWEDGKDHQLPQDFADMLGWKALAGIVDSAYSKLDKKANTLVLCDNYGQAGAINYYSKNNMQAVTFNADYINWFPEKITWDNIIVVKEAGDVPVQENEKLMFRSIKLVGEIEEVLAREFGTSVFVLEGASPEVTMIIEQQRQRRLAEDQ